MLRKALWLSVFFLHGSVLFDSLAYAAAKQGMDAVKAAIGMPIVLPDNGGVMIFDSAFELRLKRPAPHNDEIKGRVMRDFGISKICLAYGGVLPATCFQVELAKDKFIMTWKGGLQAIGIVDTGKPQNPKPQIAGRDVQKIDPVVCERLLTIVTTARKTKNYESLIDTKQDPIISADAGLPGIYFSKIKFGECLIDSESNPPRHLCTEALAANNPKSYLLFQSLNAQVQLCLADLITQSKINPDAVKNAKGQDTAVSSYQFGEHVNLVVKLGPGGKCTSLAFDGCKDAFGLTIESWVTQ